MTVNDTDTTILLWFTYQMTYHEWLIWAISIATLERFCSILSSCLIIPGGVLRLQRYYTGTDEMADLKSFNLAPCESREELAANLLFIISTKGIKS